MPTQRHVLVVDDEPDLAMLVALNLELSGWQTSIAGTGEEALAALEGDDFDAVVLDLNMPGIDGEEVLVRLREEPATRSLPVLVLSARRENGLASKLRALGADAYVAKPFSARQLVESVDALVNRARDREGAV